MEFLFSLGLIGYANRKRNGAAWDKEHSEKRHVDIPLIRLREKMTTRSLRNWAKVEKW